MRRLRVLVTDPRSPLAERLATSERVDVVVSPPRLGDVVGNVRRCDPDVVVLDAAQVGLRRLLRAWGRPVAVADPGGPDPAGPDPAGPDPAGWLAEVAHRPGAGLGGGPPVTVVVTVLNEIATVDDLARTVIAQLQPDDELVIADGGSADGTAARIEGWARRDGRVRMVSAPGTNISGGRNAAITAARNRVIVCTDAGCRPVDGWLDALRLPFAEESAPDLVTGVPRVVAETPFQWAQALACYPNPDEARRPSWLVRTYGRYLGQVMRADLPFARSLAFTVDAWKDVGGFPEDLGWVEDGAFGRAVARAHRCVIAADAEVGWVQRQSVSSTYRMYFRYGIGHAASGDVMLQCRDLARVAAYGFGLGAVASRDRRWLGAALAGSALYCSLPLARVVRYRQGWVVGALVPPAMALKDIAQAHGSVATHLRHSRRGGVG